MWLDAQLRQAGIDPAAIPGYEQEKTTHLEVAHAVQSGAATAGLGIYAAAAAYDLDFVPLTAELYQLAVPEATWEKDACQRLLGMLQERAFLSAVEALGGYNTAHTGQVQWV